MMNEEYKDKTNEEVTGKEAMKQFMQCLTCANIEKCTKQQLKIKIEVNKYGKCKYYVFPFI